MNFIKKSDFYKKIVPNKNIIKSTGNLDIITENEPIEKRNVNSAHNLDKKDKRESIVLVDIQHVDRRKKEESLKK